MTYRPFANLANALAAAAAGASPTIVAIILAHGGSYAPRVAA
jgi:hypothetical protein